MTLSEEPETPQQKSNTDGRAPGDTDTRYKGKERIQIIGEFMYLLLAITVGCAILLLLLQCACDLSDSAQAGRSGLCRASSAPVILTVALFLSGAVGGAVFALKWLYHSVARNSWHKDRFIWRISVPVMGGVLGVFAAFIFSRALGTSFDADAAKPDSLMPACGLAFLVGIFADGVLASMERLARSIFGTLEGFGGPK